MHYKFMVIDGGYAVSGSCAYVIKSLAGTCESEVAIIPDRLETLALAPNMKKLLRLFICPRNRSKMRRAA